MASSGVNTCKRQAPDSPSSESETSPSDKGSRHERPNYLTPGPAFLQAEETYALFEKNKPKEPKTKQPPKQKPPAKRPRRNPLAQPVANQTPPAQTTGPPLAHGNPGHQYPAPLPLRAPEALRAPVPLRVPVPLRAPAPLRAPVPQLPVATRQPQHNAPIRVTNTAQARNHGATTAPRQQDRYATVPRLQLPAAQISAIIPLTPELEPGERHPSTRDANPYGATGSLQVSRPTNSQTAYGYMSMKDLDKEIAAVKVSANNLAWNIFGTQEKLRRERPNGQE